ncbi:NAC domain-containing protein 68-like [Olea europaea var. sylvestris]|uniref:NAC domain-containing 67-like n=1 Tax=Olea europaea subsp. europaea TaxID=158383 RepID=A0A8S0VJJ1_OLEEU|nr:NAC domain-containing protein 68-like [Olea europaea var. sylvestris]CAA3029615.1 NAC domain-containing 67-like [Olea europaea subsp. europaea]
MENWDWETYYSPTNPEYYNSQVSDDEYSNNIWPGFVFRPTDAELILDFLTRKIKNETMSRNLMKVVDNVYKLNPENLEDDYGVNRAEEWLFFTTRDIEHENEEIRNGVGVGVDGYWQVIGEDDETIKQKDETIGFRKTLEFYKGNPPNGDKTSWIMHEIRFNDQLAADHTELDDWIVCRVFHKDNRWKDERDEDTDMIWSDSSEDSMSSNEYDDFIVARD